MVGRGKVWGVVGIELVADLSLFRPVWHSSAACVGQLDVMFGQHTHRTARKLCTGCDYVTECRAEADIAEAGLAVLHLFGIVAGENPADRVKRRRVEALEAMPVAVSA